MKKPWQIWTLFGLILSIVFVGMMFFAAKINEEDRLREVDRVESELARRKVELQERITSALYRMDWWATPLVAQEAARPYFLYEPFFRVSTVSNQVVTNRPTEEKLKNEIERPSPLLFGTSDYVLMHFQIDSNNLVTSPQRPINRLDCDNAVTCGIPLDVIRSNDDNLGIASSIASYEKVFSSCADLPSDNSVFPIKSEPTFQTVYQDPGFDRFSNSYGQVEELIDSANQQQELAYNNSAARGSKTKLQSDRNVSRGSREFAQRAQSAQSNARAQWMSQNYNVENPLSSGLVREGVMRAIWLDGKLILARRVEGEEKKLVQCCWLDWDKIQEELRKEVVDILPDVELKPIDSETALRFDRAMATLPVQLVVDSQKLLSTLALDSPSVTSGRSGLWQAMILSWIGFGLAALAIGLLFRGVIQMSERRGAFVSAVTHELRTPLTTFRMYSEMLAEKMVPPEKEQEYAETMKVEATRLSNLVENVLQFAQLEKGSCEGRLESLSVKELFGRFQDRLHQRANETGMELSLDLGSEANEILNTDAGKVEQVVFNLVDNACKYAQAADDKRVNVSVGKRGSTTEIVVQDFGPGVQGKFKKLLFKPFCKSDQDAADSAKGVGLGLALCQRMARSIGGQVVLADSEVGAKFVLKLNE